MKKALLAAAAIVALPVMAQAQSPSPGVYIGAEGGLNWLLNFNASPNNPALPPVTVSALKVTAVAAGADDVLNTRPNALPLIVSRLLPGPEIVSASETFSSPFVSVTVCALEKTAASKVIVSKPG